MRWKNIDELVSGPGSITLGRIGPIRCVAMAADEDRQLAALVRGSRESLEALLGRLDAAIGHALEDNEFVDEINGEEQSNRIVQPAGPRAAAAARKRKSRFRRARR